MAEHLHFESALEVDAETLWRWITSWECINAEMRPWLTMTPPGGTVMPNLETVPVGSSLGRSRLKVFGLVPLDWSELTLLEIEPGRGFVEQSPMGSMEMWRHERYIEAAGTGSLLVDELVFRPRFAPRLVRRVVKAFFHHRHKQLARYLNQQQRF